MVFLYMTWEVDTDYAVYIIPFGISAAVIYVLSPQIDWWWYQRRPPELPPRLRQMINTQLPFYQNLDAAAKTRFRNRMALYMEAKEFMPKGMENVPPDVKGVIAASAVQLTFGFEDYLLGKFEYIIVYPHPFPSPQYPEIWHASEIFEEDGVIMFSVEHLMASFVQPRRFFHIGFYEFARVFRRCYPEIAFPSFDENSWVKLEQISGFSKAALEKWIGLENPDPAAVAVAHFFVFPEKFQAAMPVEYGQLAGILKQQHF